LTTFGELVAEARVKVAADALNSNFAEDDQPLHAGGIGASAYADAVATYLGLACNRLMDRQSSLCGWDSGYVKIRNTFARQGFAMTWDFAEGSPFSASSGNFADANEWIVKVLAELPAVRGGSIQQLVAQNNGFHVQPACFSTDPPYYDNINYSTLADLFYVWLRSNLSDVWPDLFRRLATPKDQELVATPSRHGGRAQAESFFMNGMSEALSAMRRAATDNEPLAIYYAFKQAEASADGVTSAGWASFLQAIVDSGLSVDGTWPVRSELSNRMIGSGANALASSIVLVCRKRLADADVITRADFIRALRREMPSCIEAIRKAGVGPVDMQQSVIGPGMGVFSRCSKVLEDDDSAMPVKTALALINRVWEEIDQELDSAFDAETQVALAWFATYGFDAKPSGELITLANAKNISTNVLFASGVFQDMRGRAALTPRVELPADWTPAKDKSLTVWECVQHTARVLNAEDGGGAAAGRLVAEMGPKAAEARALAYRLFEIATQKGWAAEALIYNELAQEWPKLEDLASSAEVRATTANAQAELF
jgi:putative DNA methylase